jgi:hypothetical protein
MVPLDGFYKVRANKPRASWWCDDCRAAYGRTPEAKARKKAWNAAHPGYSTAGVRRYREDPEKREKERERSRSWKERNRERNRARDRAYQAARKAAA